MLNITLRLVGRRLHLVRQIRDCDGCENQAAHARLDTRGFLQSEIDDAVQGNVSALADFRDLAATYGFLHDVHRITDSAVLEHVAWLLQTERLIAVECRVPILLTLVAPRAASPTPAEARPRPRPVVADEPMKTWVEIELLDQTGKPVPNEKYLVTTPEGVIKSGSLDEKGRARITDIDPGTCEISFPDIDGREWKAA